MSQKILWCMVIFAVTLVRGNEVVNTLASVLIDSLEFNLQNDAFLDTNMLFGVAIVSGQLKVVDAYDIQSELRNKISRMNQLCNSIFRVAFSQNIAGIKYDKTQRTLLSPELWSFDNPPTHLPAITTLLPSEEGQTLTLTEFRNHYESCLRSLIEQCRFTAECFQVIVNYRNRGYVLTHQVLYLLIVKQVIQQNLCWMVFNSLKTKNVDFFINEKCSHVYEEMRFLEDKIHSNETVTDLLIEEAVVCGLQNYAEFFPPKYIDLIINYQSPINETVCRQKAQQVPMSSIIHLISVRIAATALYIKRAVQGEFLFSADY